MNQGVRNIIYPVKNLMEARKMFSNFLGVEPSSDSAYYVGFTIEDQQIGLDPNGYKRGPTGPVSYYHVDDIQKSMQVVLDAGGKVQQAARDVAGGRLVAITQDAGGNTIGLIQDTEEK